MSMKELIRGIQKNVLMKIEKAISVLFTRVQIKLIYERNGRIYIKASSLTNGRELTDIKIISNNLGNGRGIIVYPKVGDLGIVINLLGEYFYLGSVYDEYTSIPDNQLTKFKDSMILINKTFGSYFCIHDTEDIIIKTKTGAKIRLNEDGSFKIFNKDNYGIECSDTGVVIIRSSSIPHAETTSQGDWPDL